MTHLFVQTSHDNVAILVLTEIIASSFYPDGTYSFYQVDKSGNVKNAIDGTYTISGESLTIVMAGHSLKYDTYKVTAEEITLTDHGTETVLEKYTGKIK